MPAITSVGVGSGLDIGGLVEQLVAAEIQPTASRLNAKETKLQAKLSAFGTLKGALSSLQDALKGLGDIGAARTASSRNSEVLTVSADTSAVVGGYNIQVSQLAEAHALASRAYVSPSDVVGTGTVTLGFGAADYDPQTDTYNGFTPNPDRPPQTLTIDATNNTLEGVREAINGAHMGVDAAIVNDGTGYRLLLSSAETGLANAIQIGVSDDAGSGLADLAFDATATNLEQTVAAQDAQLVINGLAVTSASNTVDGAIQGITLGLKDSSGGDAIRVDVDLDKGAVRSALEGFIKEYNALVEQMKALTNYDPEAQTGSVLSGDGAVRSVASQLRGGLIGGVDGASELYQYLVDIGVTTDSSSKLSLDSGEFDDALGADYEGVVELLHGVAGRLDDSLAGMLETGGILEARTDGLQARIEDIGDRRTTLDRRAEALQSRYLAQFNALDTLLSQLQSTSNFLAQQLADLPTPAQLNRSDG
jgi:flagellar hook-associated protein 2